MALSPAAVTRRASWRLELLTLGVLSCLPLTQACKSSAPATETRDGAAEPLVTRPAPPLRLEPRELPLGEAPRVEFNPLNEKVFVALEEDVSRQVVGDETSRGKVIWGSARGHYAVLLLFEDSNDDGQLNPSLDQEGRPLDDRFSPYLADLRTGQLTRLEDVWRADVSNRYIGLVAQGGAPFVLDTQTDARYPIEANWGVTLTDDGNACMPARQLHLTPGGQAWGIAADEHAALARDLSSGNATRVPLPAADARLWRIEGASREWVSLLAVFEDSDRSGALELPRWRATCPCRLCAHFASTRPAGGWAGDAWRAVLASPRGDLGVVAPGFSLPVSPGVVMDTQSEALTAWRSDEAIRAPLPDGCRRVSWLRGIAPHLLYGCEDGSHWLWQPGEAPQALPVTLINPVSQEVVRSAEGTHWVATLARGPEDSSPWLARMRLEDGLVERASEALPLMAALEVQDGVAIVSGQDQAQLLDIATGERGRFDGALAAGVARPIFSRAVVSVLPAEAYSLRWEGCHLSASGREGVVENGPWRVNCVEDDAAKSSQ